MEDDRVKTFFQTAIYVTNATSIPVKLFSMYIIVFHTPEDLRHASLFLLNESFWNLVANLLLCFGNLTLMMPSQCFKFEGFASTFINAEFGGHLYFKLVNLSAVQCGCAIFLSFQFRYAAICHAFRIKKFPTFGATPTACVCTFSSLSSTY